MYEAKIMGANEKSSIPTWGVIVLIITILMGAVGWAWATVSSSAANQIKEVKADVETLKTQVNQDQVDKSSMKKDIEYIKRDVGEILDIMKHRR